MAKHRMSITINDDLHELLVSDRQTLLDVIRGQVGLTGTKRGCTTGACGVCTINNDKGRSDILVPDTRAGVGWRIDYDNRGTGIQRRTGRHPNRFH